MSGQDQESPDYLICVRYLGADSSVSPGSQPDVICVVCLRLCWRSRKARQAKGQLPVLCVECAEDVPDLVHVAPVEDEDEGG